MLVGVTVYPKIATHSSRIGLYIRIPHTIKQMFLDCNQISKAISVQISAEILIYCILKFNNITLVHANVIL